MHERVEHTVYVWTHCDRFPDFQETWKSMFTSTTLCRQQDTVSHPCADQLVLSFTFNSQLKHISQVCLKYAPIFFPYWKKRKLSHDFLRISGEANLTKPSVSQLLFALSKIWRGFKRNFFKLTAWNFYYSGGDERTMFRPMNRSLNFKVHLEDMLGFFFCQVRCCYKTCSINSLCWVQIIKKNLSCKDKFHKFHSTKAHAHFQLPLWCCTNVWLLFAMLIFCPTKS